MASLVRVAGLVLLYICIFAYYQPAILLQPLEVVSDHGDGILNYWMLTHGLKTIGNLSWHDFWSGNIFFPLDATMSLSDTLLFQVLATWPWVKAGVPPIVAYNLSIPVFFVLNGLVCFLFLRRLTRDQYAAMVGSAIFAVSAFWFGHITHYQLLPTFWYPLITWMLWLFFETQKWRYWALHAVFLVGLAMSSPYLFLLFVPPLGILYVCMILALKPLWSTRNALKAATTLSSAGALIGVFYLPYLRAKRLFGLERLADEQALYSLRIKSFTSFAGQFWPEFLLKPARHYGEGHIYLGSFLLLSLPLIIFAVFRPQKTNQTLRVRGLMALALILGFLCVWAALGPQTRAFGGVSLWKVWGLVPGFGGMRVPARYGFLIHFFFGTAVALWLRRIVPKTYRKLLATLWLGFLILEMKPSSIYSKSFDQRPTQGIVDFLNKENSGDPLLLFPLYQEDQDLFIVASSINNNIVNGRSGWTPYLHEHFIWPNLEDCRTHGCLTLLRRLGVRFVAVKKSDSGMTDTIGFLSRSLPTQFEDDFYRLFDLGHANVRRNLYPGDKAFLAASAQILRAIDCNIPYTVALHDWVDTNSLIPLSSGGWSSRERQDLAPTLRLKLPQQWAGDLALKLSDGAKTIPSSNFVRKPSVEAYRFGAKVEVDYWPDLALEGDEIVQWINIHPTRAIDEIIIRAIPARFVDKDWTVRRLDICRAIRSI